MPFLTEPEPPRGIPLPALPGVARIVARNPGPMTYHGTNTWLIEGADGAVVLDPGPDDPQHVRDILAATGGRVARILVTHTHSDHVGAAAALRAATGAPTAGFLRPAAPGFVPDIALGDGDEIAGLTVLHTPGHAADHLCLARPDGVLFSADHVMSWNTSVVSPPDGDMAAYLDSLRRLLARADHLYLPGHGPPLPEPRALVRELIAHREAREAAILAAIRARALTAEAIVGAVYGPLDPRLVRAASRSVLAHLLKLEAEGRAAREGEAWRGLTPATS